MGKIDFERLILSIFKEDVRKNNKHTSNTQVCLLSIKSLLPSEDIIGNYIDYRRFFEEIKLWKLYREGMLEHLYCSLKNKELENIYYKKDKHLYLRTIPIIIANTDFSMVEREVIKNILFTTGNIESLFEGLVLAKYLDSKANGEKIVESLKDYIINFSQDEYLEKYESLYRVPFKEKKSFHIEFEKEKISILNILNGIRVNNLNGHGLLKDILDIEDGNYETMRSNEGEILIQSLVSNYKTPIQLNDFYKEISDYLLKLRKSRISPEDLKIENYILPDVFSYSQGETFYHSILNKSIVIKKEVSEHSITSLIKNKSGIYKFRSKL